MITNFYKNVNESFSVAHFALQNTKFGSEKGKVQKPARIPPQTPPAGGKSAEAGRIHSPRQIVSPCLVRISIFNHLDFARNTFELCPTNTARNRNRILKPNRGRHEVPTQMYSPPKILNLKGFATLRVAPRLPIQNYE